MKPSTLLAELEKQVLRQNSSVRWRPFRRENSRRKKISCKIYTLVEILSNCVEILREAFSCGFWSSLGEFKDVCCWSLCYWYSLSFCALLRLRVFLEENGENFVGSQQRKRADRDKQNDEVVQRISKIDSEFTKLEQWLYIQTQTHESYGGNEKNEKQQSVITIFADDIITQLACSDSEFHYGLDFMRQL